MELRVSVKGQEDLIGFFLPAQMGNCDYITPISGPASSIRDLD